MTKIKTFKVVSCLEYLCDHLSLNLMLRKSLNGKFSHFSFFLLCVCVCMCVTGGLCVFLQLWEIRPRREPGPPAVRVAREGCAVTQRVLEAAASQDPWTLPLPVQVGGFYIDTFSGLQVGTVCLHMGSKNLSSATWNLAALQIFFSK